MKLLLLLFLFALFTGCAGTEKTEKSEEKQVTEKESEVIEDELDCGCGGVPPVR